MNFGEETKRKVCRSARERHKRVRDLFAVFLINLKNYGTAAVSASAPSLALAPTKQKKILLCFISLILTWSVIVQKHVAFFSVSVFVRFFG